MKKYWKKAVKILAFLGIFCVLVWGVTTVLLPKLPDFYKKEEWDVVFFGSSASYCTFSPAVFDEYGLESYNRGRQQQPVNYTYYYIKDALDVAEIDVVVLEIFSLTYWEGYELFTDADVRDSSLNDMRYSMVKYEAIADCIEPELQLSYLFPLDKYHSNWENLDYSSVEAFWNDVSKRYYTEESERGFYPWTTAQPCLYWSEEVLNSEMRWDVYEFNMKYLELIYEECAANGAELVLVRSPLPCDEYIIGTTNSLADWAGEHGVPLINYMRLTEEIGIDWQNDCLDGGSHLNLYGAEKVSHHLAEYILDNYNVK